jgi:hypothetical protein
MQDLLQSISIYSALLPILVFLLCLKRVTEKPIWVIFFYSLYTALNDLTLLYKPDIVENQNYLLYYFTLFEYLAFATLLYFFLYKKIVRLIIIATSLVFIGICIYMIHFKHVKDFDSIQTSLECILIILFCLYFFYEKLITPKFELIYGNYRFWVVLTLLIYLSGAFFLFAFASDLPFAEKQKYWPILYVCNILKNILFSVAIYVSTKQIENDSYESLI